MNMIYIVQSYSYRLFFMFVIVFHAVFNSYYIEISYSKFYSPTNNTIFLHSNMSVNMVIT